MIETKHTPGPWYISDHSELYIVQKDEEGPEEYAICKMHTAWGEEERKANSKLIASAPDLLQALIDASVTLKAFLPSAFVTIGVVESAIKKATL